MVSKIQNKLIFLFFIFFFITINSQANIIYDKNNTVITELDLKYYKQIHYDRFNEEINDSKAIKNLVMIKRLVISLKKNNSGFLEKIDTIILNEIGEENIKSETIFDIIRYYKTRNEFVSNYLKNDFNKFDLENIFKSFNNLKLPISKNNCLTIIKIIDLTNNKEFVNVFFENLKNQSEDYEILIDNALYNICINQQNKNIIDREIFKYVEFRTENEFKKFIYAQ